MGDGTVVVRTIAHPAVAEGPDVLALATDADAERALTRTHAISAVVGRGRHAALAGLRGGIVVHRPRLALARLLELFARPPFVARGIHPSAVIDASAAIGAEVSIGACCYVGPGARIGARTTILPHVTVGADAVIGDDCLIHAGVRIGDRCVLGHRLILQPNAVIGADGFGIVTPTKGNVESAMETGDQVEATNSALIRVNSIGSVVLEDDVELGAGTCVDRGTIGATRIGRGTKIDNLVQIGHNCTIGEDCLIAGTAAISGSVTVGNRVAIGGGVGIVDHVSIGDDAVIVARSGVGVSVPPRQVWGGYPAVPYPEAIQQMFLARRGSRIVRDLQALRQRMAELERQLLGVTTGSGA